MTNAEKLRQYKADYGLPTHKVAKLLGVAVVTVDRWLLSTSSPFHKQMPDSRVNHLKLRLRDKKKV